MTPLDGLEVLRIDGRSYLTRKDVLALKRAQGLAVTWPMVRRAVRLGTLPSILIFAGGRGPSRGRGARRRLVELRAAWTWVPKSLQQWGRKPYLVLLSNEEVEIVLGMSRYVRVRPPDWVTENMPLPVELFRRVKWLEKCRQEHRVRWDRGLTLEWEFDPTTVDYREMPEDFEPFASWDERWAWLREKREGDALMRMYADDRTDLTDPELGA